MFRNINEKGKSSISSGFTHSQYDLSFVSSPHVPPSVCYLYYTYLFSSPGLVMTKIIQIVVYILL